MELECVDVDLERLNLAWQRLIDRHDMLRAIVLPEGQQQVLERVPPYQIEVLDLRGHDPQAGRISVGGPSRTHVPSGAAE